MSIWDSLFGRAPAYDPSGEPEFRFGRYSDAYKSRENYAAWERALENFEEGAFLESIAAFLDYIGNPEEGNVQYRWKGKKLYFEFYQGSKRITGLADEEQLRVSARIAKLERENVELLHRLTDQNFELKYSRYAIDESNCLTIVFDSLLTDASPHKLYHALKEVAQSADKQDDLLIQEFGDDLSPVEVTHLHPLDPTARKVKLDFLQERIGSLIDYLATNTLNPEEHPGAVAFLLLDVVYRLDYLLIPEGYTMEALERMHRMYFSRESTDQPVSYKNVRLLRELQQLLRRAPENFQEELYVGKSTFGITLPASHDRLASLIDSELPNMDWYKNNGYQEVAQAVPGYIVGYTLFNFAVPPPDRELLHLYYRVTENDYFRDLGYDQPFVDAAGRPLRRTLRTAIEDIQTRYQTTYPRLRPALSQLRYGNLIDFGKSYLEMLRDIDLSRP